jgi:hypothetical protein
VNLERQTLQTEPGIKLEARLDQPQIAPDAVRTERENPVVLVGHLLPAQRRKSAPTRLGRAT